MAFSIDDGLLTGLLEVPDPDYQVVASGRELQRLCAEILGPREQPVIGLTLDEEVRDHLLPPSRGDSPRRGTVNRQQGTSAHAGGRCRR